MTKIFQKVLLDSILAILKKTPKWNKKFSQIAKLKQINYCYAEGHTSSKSKSPICPECSKQTTNWLILLVHLQMLHQKGMEVTKYQIKNQFMTIYIKKRRSPESNYIQETKNGGYMLRGKHSTRVSSIIESILEKLVKKTESIRKTYFHSGDIFRQVGMESEDEDSEAELGQIERQLEKLRINQFTDVNQSDKLFFVTWNNAVYEARKESKLIDHQEMISILGKFAITAKTLSIKRISLVMHAWTLWSAGKISAFDVTTFLNAYDTAPAPAPKPTNALSSSMN